MENSNENLSEYGWVGGNVNTGLEEEETETDRILKQALMENQDCKEEETDERIDDDTVQKCISTTNQIEEVTGPSTFTDDMVEPEAENASSSDSHTSSVKHSRGCTPIDEFGRVIPIQDKQSTEVTDDKNTEFEEKSEKKDHHEHRHRDRRRRHRSSDKKRRSRSRSRSRDRHHRSHRHKHRSSHHHHREKHSRHRSRSPENSSYRSSSRRSPYSNRRSKDDSGPGESYEKSKERLLQFLKTGTKEMSELIERIVTRAGVTLPQFIKKCETEETIMYNENNRKIFIRDLVKEAMTRINSRAEELTGIQVPKYYNRGIMNPLKFVEQQQKRKMLWSKANDNRETKEKQWNLQFSEPDKSEKFRKLMGIKSSGETSTDQVNNSNSLEHTKQSGQNEMFETLDKEYQSARMTTHMQRGMGLGFGSFNMEEAAAILRSRMQQPQQPLSQKPLLTASVLEKQEKSKITPVTTSESKQYQTNEYGRPISSMSRPKTVFPNFQQY